MVTYKEPTLKGKTGRNSVVSDQQSATEWGEVTLAGVADPRVAAAIYGVQGSVGAP